MVTITELNRAPDGRFESLEATSGTVANSPTNDTDIARKKEVDNAGKTDKEIAAIAMAYNFVVGD